MSSVRSDLSWLVIAALFIGLSVGAVYGGFVLYSSTIQSGTSTSLATASGSSFSLGYIDLPPYTPVNATLPFSIGITNNANYPIVAYITYPDFLNVTTAFQNGTSLLSYQTLPVSVSVEISQSLKNDTRIEFRGVKT
jgi:hypothetical protein